ncbi:MAG: hypothetical protein PHI35_08580 [Victivallaceae bacterium]|nr:hypothetical protein [Victivallaceae bacterium]
MKRVNAGQVLLEYAIMLVLALLLVFAVIALFGAVSTNGGRLIDVAGFNVP